ncbi:FAD:protein FMN transferase [Paenibacillus frigoriresistens]|uniref:FAD:protein FMN transferase n=1 Tax=Paenibacillus alginolyticus TaxID=59839 RepID=UPI0015656CAC|nr:FAD:protein FMN transferase [Paenibacillus frigoriresistens]NRF92124.1 FAD:protein FMN transferase [Paenibacillus frigoriresistens]
MERITQYLHPFHFQTLESTIEMLLHCEEKDTTLINKQAMDWFRSVEKRFSTNLADSEISLLNALAGENCLVSTTMLEVLFLAEAYQAITDGNYFPLLQKSAPMGLEKAPATLEWEVDPAMKSIKLPNHTNIDLRGIEKSWSIKRLAEYMQKNMSLEQGLILAGGDITVWGRGSQKLDPWVIGIQNPWNANAKLGAIAMSEGSLSTYSPFEDKMSTPGSDIVQCTVAGQDMVECQVWARILCTLGVEEGLALLAKRTSDCEAVVHSTNQEMHYFGREASLNRRWLDMHIDHYYFQD